MFKEILLIINFISTFLYSAAYLGCPLDLFLKCYFIIFLDKWNFAEGPVENELSEISVLFYLAIYSQSVIFFLFIQQNKIYRFRVLLYTTVATVVITIVCFILGQVNETTWKFQDHSMNDYIIVSSKLIRL